MKCFFFVVLSLLCVSVITQAAPFDSGMRQWSQPDNTTFVARAWGDEFFWWMETEDGYRIVQGSGDWFYYATLDENGEFAPTDARVGIDSPPSESYKLERSASRIAEIEQLIAETNAQTEDARLWFEQQQAANPGAPVVLRIAVIFVEFQDFRHYTGGTRPLGYLKADFDSMLFSHNWYNVSQRHPEGDSLYGSFRDYWHQMSRGQFIVQGTFINPVDANSVPRWILLDHDRLSYAYHVNPYLLRNEGFQKAIDSSVINPSEWPDPRGYDKYIYVFAQNEPAGYRITHGGDRTFIQCPERHGVELVGQNLVAFAHMGTYAHEFGHNLGFQDEYCSRGACGPYSGNTCLFTYDLMAWGIYNGPDRKGACPATLSPYYRIQKSWVTPIELWFTTTNFVAEYDYNNPKIYKITPAGAQNDEHYLIETKLRHGFDLYIPTSPDSFVYQPGTLLIWHHNISSECYDDAVRVTHADNTADWGSFLTDLFPSNAVSNTQTLNDVTTPGATLGSGPPAYPDCRNERRAHFVLNGIHKLPNGNTLIDTVNTRHAIIPTAVVNGWHMLGVPVTVPNYAKTAVYPTASSAAFAYVCGQGYVARDTLKNGPGYFIKFDSTQTLILAGGIREIDTAIVCANWNLVGSITDAIPLSNICLYPYPDNQLLSVFKYQNGYVPVDTITPGLGHWVKVSMAGLLVFRRDPWDCGAGGDGLAMSDFDHFTITDAEGKQQDVYVANLEHDPSLTQRDLTMPPALPGAEFDARFEAGEFVKTVSPDSGLVELVINVETQAYPVTVTWELNPENGIEYSVITEGMGKQQASNRLAQSGSAAMTNISGGKFRMSAQATRGAGSDNLPTQYSLAQNYPNPFNPETRIHFELPQDSPARLVVYDLLGREVATVVNEFKKAGRYDVTFSARNLASGVYFYRLQAGTFNDAKKLLLLR
jgi:hypothetical protein